MICLAVMQAMSLGSTVTAQDNLKGYEKENMNTSVRPGDDFVEYATGNWLKNHPLRNDQMSNGAFMDLYELNQKQIQELILQFSTTKQEPGSLGYKIGTLYNQMMDSTTRNNMGISPIMPVIEKIRAVKDRKEYRVLQVLYLFQALMRMEICLGRITVAQN